VCGVELAVETDLSAGLREAECEEEQGEKDRVKTETTDRRSIHSGKSLYSKGA
jgi:hypothetical protein